LLLCITLSLMGCDLQVSNEAPATPTVLIVPSTLAPTSAPRPTETPLPPPPQPTITPVEGTTSTQINVRAEPSTGSNVLGIIPANTRVEITGKDPGENWWQINYPQGADPEGKGWVTAQYVTTASRPEVPTIGGEGAGANDGNVAVVQQQLNVRSGPGTDFNSLGTLKPQDVVSLTGKDPNGAWLQIDFVSGPEGKGWVNAAFVQAQGVDLSGLPIITEAGAIVGTGTPTGIPSTLTPTVVPAWEDNDSPNNPVVSVIFEPTGTRSLIYNGDVSAPTGDAEDWIQFTPYSNTVLVEVACKGSEMLNIELLQNGSVIQGAAEVNCANRQIVPVEPDKPAQVHVSAASNGPLDYSSYTLNIKTFP